MTRRHTVRLICASAATFLLLGPVGPTTTFARTPDLARTANLEVHHCHTSKAHPWSARVNAGSDEVAGPMSGSQAQEG